MPTPQEIKNTLAKNTRQMPNGCIKWIGAFPYGNNTRFPRIGNELAIHAAFRVLRPAVEIDANRKVNLTCGNKWCVNPEHASFGDVIEKPAKTIAMHGDVEEQLRTLNLKLDMIIELITRQPQLVEEIESTDSVFDAIVEHMPEPLAELPKVYNGIKVFAWAEYEPRVSMNDDAFIMPFPNDNPVFTDALIMNAMCIECDKYLTVPPGSYWLHHVCGNWLAPAHS